MSELQKNIHALMAQPTLASFATVTQDGAPWGRYVVAKGDKDLNLFFATFSQSRKVEQVAANPAVHVTLASGDMENPGPYLQIEGRAEMLTDAETKQAVWYDMLGKIFQGPDDPMYIVCKVTPQRIEYTLPVPGKPPQVWQP